MVERHRVVPDRVPEAVGELHDVRPAVVYEQQVEVTTGSQVATAEAPDGQERKALCGVFITYTWPAAAQGQPLPFPPSATSTGSSAERPVEDLGQPAVGEVAGCFAPVTAAKGRVLSKELSLIHI